MVTDTGLSHSIPSTSLWHTRITTENEHNYRRARDDAIRTEPDHCYSLPPQATNIDIRIYLNLAYQYAVNVITYKAEMTGNYSSCP